MICKLLFIVGFACAAVSAHVDCNGLSKDLTTLHISFKSENSADEMQGEKRITGYGLADSCGKCPSFGNNVPEVVKCKELGACNYLKFIAKQYNVDLYRHPSPPHSQVDPSRKWTWQFLNEEGCNPDFRDGFKH